MKRLQMKKSLPFIGMIGFSELLVILASGLAAYLTFSFYNYRILPNTTINGVPVGGLTIEEATPLLQSTELALPEKDLVLSVDDITIASGSGELGIHYNYDSVVKDAYMNGKIGSVFSRFIDIVKSVFIKNEYQAVPVLDEDKAIEFVTLLKLDVDIIGEYPSAKLGYSGSAASLEINEGKPGRILDLDTNVELLQSGVKNNKYNFRADVASTSARLTPEEIEESEQRLLKLIDSNIYFSDPDDPATKVTINDQNIVSFLNLPAGYNELEISDFVTNLAEVVNRKAQDAEFEYDSESLKVEKFVPDKTGLELNELETIEIIRNSLRELEKIASEENEDEAAPSISKELPLIKTQPNITLESSNDLGIKERIGYGDSEYAHSIPNRIHNVKITTDKVNNIIVPPGEEFSFNQALGEVSARTGYRTAYVIKNGRTELGDGGGVCQVSTTFFRAVLNAGLKISRRIPHSYRVSYYELDSKPGIDATVYSGNIDFRFINDTDHHILLHTQADSENLTMFVEIYGTSDGRTAEISDHVTWDYRPAPPPEFYPDPSLPSGVRKQIDWAAAGIKAKFTNTVRDANGEIISQETYTSNYKPWSAKYLVGE